MKATRFSLQALLLAGISVPGFAADTAPKGVANFHKVNDHIYRGAQPTADGFRSLSAMGVKTVIDLRGDHSFQAEAQAVRAAGMRFVSFPMSGLAAPTNGLVTKVLTALDSGEPVFVHCKEGKDRTGTVIACYRVAHDRWTNEKALEEAKSYGMHWFETAMRAYILAFQTPAAAPTLAGLSLQSAVAH
jgi:protein tyrosine/serine phosphatase